MKIEDVRAKAFAMPLNDPAYPRPPYRFYNREFVVITYRTDPQVLREVVPEPLEVAGDTVAYEFIRMPDSTGFGDYTETGQVIPVRFKTPSGEVQEGGYVHAMYLDDNSPIAGGREIWGFPKKLATPKLAHEQETLVGTLHYGSILCVSATMGYKHRELDLGPIAKAMAKPAFMIKIIPARRLHAPHLRARALLHGGREAERGVVRAGGAAAVRACHVRCRAPARPRGGVGDPLHRRPDVGARRGRLRLPRLTLRHRMPAVVRHPRTAAHNQGPVTCRVSKEGSQSSPAPPAA